MGARCWSLDVYTSCHITAQECGGSQLDDLSDLPARHKKKVPV